MASSMFPCLYLNKKNEPILILFQFLKVPILKSVTSDIKNPIISVSTPSLCVRVLICVRDEFRFSY